MDSVTAEEPTSLGDSVAGEHSSCLHSDTQEVSDVAGSHSVAASSSSSTLSSAGEFSCDACNAKRKESEDQTHDYSDQCNDGDKSMSIIILDYHIQSISAITMSCLAVYFAGLSPPIECPLWRRVLIGGVIAPHGITDIIDQKNDWQKWKYILVLSMLSIMDCMIFNHSDFITYKLSILTAFSIYHFSFDLVVSANDNDDNDGSSSIIIDQSGWLLSSVIHFICIVMLDQPYGFDVFLMYMVFIHVPIHYSKHFDFTLLLRSHHNGTHLLMNPSIILCFSFTLFSLLISWDPSWFSWIALHFPICSIIITHIMFCD